MTVVAICDECTGGVLVWVEGSSFETLATVNPQPAATNRSLRDDLRLISTLVGNVSDGKAMSIGILISILKVGHSEPNAARGSSAGLSPIAKAQLDVRYTMRELRRCSLLAGQLRLIVETGETFVDNGKSEPSGVSGEENPHSNWRQITTGRILD